MKKSTTAALISGLVFPGLGHLYLRCYLIGLILLLVSSWSFYSIIVAIVDSAMDIATQIEIGSQAIDTQALEQQLSKEIEQSTDVPFIVLIITWVIGILDSYRLGSAQQNAEDED